MSVVTNLAANGRNFDLTRLVNLSDEDFALVDQLVDQMVNGTAVPAPMSGALTAMELYKLSAEKKEFMRRMANMFRQEDSEIGQLSDGYHTYNELYHHRAVLFATLCNFIAHQETEWMHSGGYLTATAWKSRKHHDPEFPMYDGMFIAGLDIAGVGQATYHCDNKYWDLFKVKELTTAPEYDGHTPDDAIERILETFCK